MSNLPDPGSDGPAPRDERQPTPAELRSLGLLRVLVTLLTGTMILGIAALVTLLYLRLPGASSVTPPPPTLPDGLTLPAGATAQAVTAGQGWWAIVTAEGSILLYDGDGALMRELQAEELAPE
ncbi:MAG: DUF6476 family protein [Pseudomonadota bacterium]